MAFFNRNRNQIDQVPLEVQEYYQSERRERTGMAWLLALATLGVTVALAAALFYGGKWAYRSIANRNKKPQTAQNTNGQSTQQPTVTNTPDSGTPGSPTGTSSTSTNTPSPATPTPPSPSSATATTPQPTTSTSTGTAAAGSSAATQGGRLVNTGPSNVMTGFIVVSIGGTIAHYAYTAKRARL